MYMKTCTICKIPKDESSFNKNKCRRDGLQNTCKMCSRKNSKKYYDRNPVLHRLNVKKRRKDLVEWVRTLKVNCSQCHQPHIATLDFHHIDSTEKEITISNAVSNMGWSKKRLLEEISKCKVLCSNCHRILEWEKRFSISAGIV